METPDEMKEKFDAFLGTKGKPLTPIGPHSRWVTFAERDMAEFVAALALDEDRLRRLGCVADGVVTLGAEYFGEGDG